MVREKAEKTHLPCPDCGSSDALCVYPDGHTYCFSCGIVTDDFGNKRGQQKASSNPGARRRKASKRNVLPQKGYLSPSAWPQPSGYRRDNDSSEGTSEEDNDLQTPSLKGETKKNVPLYLRNNTIRTNTMNDNIPKEEPKDDPKDNTLSIILKNRERASPHRGLNQATLDAYGVRLGPNNSVAFDYGQGTKFRSLDKKQFWTEGPFKDAKLFGQGLFNAGSAKAITITEGEYDAMSVYQMMGGYPAVSIRSGAAGARADCEKHRDYLNSFSQIYLCFDNDQPGQEAAAAVAQLFDPNKVYIVSLDKFKDANEYLTNKADKEFYKVWWAAKRWRPKGIISGYDEVLEILSKKGAETVAHFPFKRLDDMALGIRLGEVNLFTALEKRGKTEVMGAIEYHLLKTTDFNIGIIHLEEKEQRAMQRLITYELDTPVHRPESTASLEDQIQAYKEITKKDDRVYYYQHFGSDDPNIILDIIRHMVVVHHCRFVFLDHITMLVTGFEGDDERKKLDYLSTAFATIARELNFTMFLVSHVNDQGQTRGSRNISKTADLIVHLDRDIEAADEEVRNTTNLLVKGNRFGSDTGPGGKLKFDRKTFKLSEVEEANYRLRSGEGTASAKQDTTKEGFNQKLEPASVVSYTRFKENT